jgi:hypothetical protein
MKVQLGNVVVLGWTQEFNKDQLSFLALVIPKQYDTLEKASRKKANGTVLL